jgi:cell division protein FtsB
MNGEPPKVSPANSTLLQWSLEFRFGKWFWVAWLLIVSGFAVWSWKGENGFETANRLRDQRVALQKENGILKQSNERLRQEIRLIQQDPSFLEWIAKERLGMIEENERLYVFQK